MPSNPETELVLNFDRNKKVVFMVLDPVSTLHLVDL